MPRALVSDVIKRAQVLSEPYGDACAAEFPEVLTDSGGDIFAYLLNEGDGEVIARALNENIHARGLLRRALAYLPADSEMRAVLCNDIMKFLKGAR